MTKQNLIDFAAVNLSECNNPTHPDCLFVKVVEKYALTPRIAECVREIFENYHMGLTPLYQVRDLILDVYAVENGGSLSI